MVCTHLTAMAPVPVEPRQAPKTVQIPARAGRAPGRVRRYWSYGRAGVVARVCALAACLSSASARAEPARPADDFVDAIGANVHFSYSNYIDQFESVVVPRLQELGIRHIRDGILL